MITKNVLIQYTDLQAEIKETQVKIEKLEQAIRKTENRIREIETNCETVRDKVSGGYGGNQSFYIEGLPMREYEKKRSDLMVKNLLLNQRKSTLEILKFDLLQKTNEVEEFISRIDDSRMRRIINLRFIERLSWNQVADRIGGGNTEDSVRMAFNRFLEK